MSTKQLYRGSAGWYVVEYPADWRADESESLVTLYRSESGIGALQLSAYRTPGKQDTTEVLIEYLSDQKVPIDVASVSVTKEGFKEVSTYGYLENDSYWHVWVVSQGSYLVFVTYNCNAADQDNELQSVLEIVNSVTIDSEQ